MLTPQDFGWQLSIVSLYKWLLNQKAKCSYWKNPDCQDQQNYIRKLITTLKYPRRREWFKLVACASRHDTIIASAKRPEVLVIKWANLDTASSVAFSSDWMEEFRKPKFKQETKSTSKDKLLKLFNLGEQVQTFPPSTRERLFCARGECERRAAGSWGAAAPTMHGGRCHEK